MYEAINETVAADDLRVYEIAKGDSAIFELSLKLGILPLRSCCKVRPPFPYESG